ncbi:MAG: hypothetical protein H0V23_05705 [Nocardioidaceae bacterium]|nr:hypothetical protein [Nocardioidaceae bacterium]
MSDQWSSQEPSTWQEPSETSSTTDTAKAEAGNIAQTSKESASQVAGTAKEQGQQVLSEATSQARNLVGETRSQIGQQANAQQERAAGSLRSIGDQLDNMVANSEDGLAAQLVQQASDQVKQVAGWLENRDPNGLLDDVRSFARRKPGAFLLGAAGAGLVAGRLTRAGVDLKRSDSGSNADYDPTSVPPAYPYDTSDVGGTPGTYAAGTYGTGTYAGDTYSGDTYAGETYPAETYPEEPYTGGTHVAGTSPNEPVWADPGEPQR